MKVKLLKKLRAEARSRVTIYSVTTEESWEFAHRSNNDIPAWSLHRLLCLYNVHYLEFMGDEEIAGAYDIVIDAITLAIEGGYFNEKYLV
jgi:hypothetical protein